MNDSKLCQQKIQLSVFLLNTNSKELYQSINLQTKINPNGKS